MSELSDMLSKQLIFMDVFDTYQWIFLKATKQKPIIQQTKTIFFRFI